LTSTAANATDWRFVFPSGKKPDRTLFWINVESIKRNGDEVRSWIEDVWEKPGPLGTNVSIRLMAFDCSEKTYRTISGSFYRDNAPTGDFTPEPAKYVIPDSSMDYVLKAVCDRTYGATPVDDPLAMSMALFAKIN
jgi:hypothetical protein